MSGPQGVWSPLIVSVHVSLPPDPPARQDVTGTACSTVPGLAVTYAGEDRWTVTHLRSGLAVTEAPSKAQACDVLAALSPLDWTRSDAALRLDAAVPLAIGRALAAAGALERPQTAPRPLEVAPPALEAMRPSTAIREAC